MQIEIESTEEFEDWLSQLPPKYEGQVRKRFLAIQE
jgi:hypothetical protein